MPQGFADLSLISASCCCVRFDARCLCIPYASRAWASRPSKKTAVKTRQRSPGGSEQQGRAIKRPLATGAAAAAHAAKCVSLLQAHRRPNGSRCLAFPKVAEDDLVLLRGLWDHCLYFLRAPPYTRAMKKCLAFVSIVVCCCRHVPRIIVPAVLLKIKADDLLRCRLLIRLPGPGPRIVSTRMLLLLSR